jgi:hypothetical protein
VQFAVICTGKVEISPCIAKWSRDPSHPYCIGPTVYRPYGLLTNSVDHRKPSQRMPSNRWVWTADIKIQFEVSRGYKGAITNQKELRAAPAYSQGGESMVDVVFAGLEKQSRNS